jgi:hypothetical protein
VPGIHESGGIGSHVHPPNVVPCGSPGSPLTATSRRMGKRWKHRTPGCAAQPPAGERPSVSWLVEASKRRHSPPSEPSPLHFLSSPLSASGRASAGWWKRPGVARLPVRNKTPPPSRGLVNQIGRLVRGPAARVPPLPHNDVWSTDRVSLWERVGVRAKTPRPWGRTYWFVPPLDLQPQTTVHRVHPQRRGSPDLRVRRGIGFPTCLRCVSSQKPRRMGRSPA